MKFSSSTFLRLPQKKKKFMKNCGNIEFKATKESGLVIKIQLTLKKYSGEKDRNIFTTFSLQKHLTCTKLYLIPMLSLIKSLRKIVSGIQQNENREWILLFGLFSMRFRERDFLLLFINVITDEQFYIRQKLEMMMTTKKKKRWK